MKISDTVVGAGFVAAGALIVAGTLQYPTLDGGHPGPALFPRILGTLMAVFGGLVSAKGLRARDVTEDVDWRRLHQSAGFLNALVVLFGVLGWILTVHRLGFLLASATLLFVVMWRLRVPATRTLVVSLVFTGVVYFLFAKVMRVPLSLGILWW